MIRSKRKDILMDIKEICPCPKIACANHADCEKCTSSHLKKGSLNFCGFHTILPTLQEAIAASPESATAKKLNALIEGQLQTYEKLMTSNNLSKENQNVLLQKMSELYDQ